jgi:peptide/nickel transport system substrate-binding protein
VKPTKRFRILIPIIAILSLLLSSAYASIGSAQSEVPREETLIIAMGNQKEDPTNFNMTSWTGADRSQGLHQYVYEYFFYQNLQTGEYIPWLAESYEYNADYTALTVKLRDGVLWNDGEPFTADDVVFTYDMILANPTMAWGDVVAANVKSVEKVDDLNVTFNLTSANPRFHSNREAFPVVGIWGGITIQPKHIWEGQDPTTFKNNPPVGTGPYRLKDATQTAIIWERRDDWWGTTVFGATPAPKEIHLVNLGAETNVAFALANDEIDAEYIGILSAGSYQEVANRNENVTAWSGDAPYSWPDPCPRLLMVNNQVESLSNKDVRWAISNLIDRDLVVELAYEGATTPLWGLWPEYTGYQATFDAIQDLRDQYQPGTYDPDKAATFFEQAGVNPEDLSLRYVVNADSNEEVRVGQVIADQLSAAGIDVEVTPLSGSVLNDAILRGDYDLKLNSFCAGDTALSLELYHSKFSKPIGEPVGLFERNSFRFENAEFDAVVDKMLTTAPDDPAMTQLTHDAMAIWFDQLPVIPIVQAPALVPVNSTYWSNWPTAENPWNMPVPWWATFNLVITGYPNPETGEWIQGIQPAEAAT